MTAPRRDDPEQARLYTNIWYYEVDGACGEKWCLCRCPDRAVRFSRVFALRKVEK